MKKQRQLYRVLFAAPLVLGVAQGDALAGPKYSITDLGTLSGTFSHGFNVNDAGQVAGFAYSQANAAVRAALGLSGLGFQDLGTLGGTYSESLDINSTGQQAGTSALAGDLSAHAFLGSAGVLQDLGTLGGTNSRGLGISDVGEVAGASQLKGDAAEHAFLFSKGKLQDLGTLGGTNSQANDTNSTSQVTGYSELAGATGFHAVVWRNGKMQDLGTLGGNYSEGIRINENGWVTGYASTTGDLQHRAVLWVPGQPVKDLGTLGGSFSTGYGINLTGNVVGFATNGGNIARMAFLWDGTSMQDLNTLILPNSGWFLTEAHGISDSGNIVGVGQINAERRAFLLTPDKTLPVITCPADVTATTSPTSIGQATATDNLDPAPVVTNNRPATFPGGTTVVTWTATDAAGNKGTCNQNVTVQGDTTPPVVTPQWTPAAPNGLNGWYVTTPVTLAWSVTDKESTVTSKVGCAAVSLTADTAGQSSSCTATSAGGTTGPVSTSAKVDGTPPVLTYPAPITQNATGPTGAIVTYPLPTVTDALSGPGAAGATCSPVSGSTFPLGTTNVVCSGKDNAGNTGNGSFTVTVVDPTPPVVVPSVTGTAGLNGWYVGPVAVTFSVSDNESAITSQTAGCAGASISTDTAGVLIDCSATSAGGTTGPVTASVRLDATRPAVAVPADIAVTAASSSGAVVTYPAATATDATSGVSGAGVSCSPASGSTFPVGTTAVQCGTSDNAGNVGTGSFNVTVTASTTTPPPPSETIGVSLAECKRLSAASGEWKVQGTSSIATSNSIQLYATATVPADLASSTIGRPAAVASNGQWTVQVKPGPACTSPISLITSATATKKENIGVAVK